MEVFNTVGRRKSSVARIYMNKGNGEIKINKRGLEDYFPSVVLRMVVNQPFVKLGLIDQYNLKVNVEGGGLKGQAEAIRLAVSRALCKVNLENKALLKKEGYITRDPREVERKKYGHKKARKKFQFSKR